MFYASNGAEPEEDTSIGRGTRRKKFAGYLRAANELRQSYLDSYSQHNEFESEESRIPGAFPNLKISHNGAEEMVLFPSYARRHVRTTLNLPRPAVAGGDDLHRDPGDAEYWRREWEIHEDANAIVDVDVRGWIYTPARGAMTRKNRLLMSVARKISGIPAPGESVAESLASSRASSTGRGRSQHHEDELAERQALEIAARGEQEADIAERGGYSEKPTSLRGRDRSRSPRPGEIVQPVTDTSMDGSELGQLSTHSSWAKPSEMSPEELAEANSHLINRLRPFMTTPVASMSLTIFFYNDKTSQSRTTRTNDSGHFNFRAALDFVPTNIRVLASETLSASEEVIITESRGVSVISDIDDTIKHTAIAEGAREIFRNAFIRNLSDLKIPGVQEWYSSMTKLGVAIHYVSNSPWQMYPVLHSYFHEAGLPPGSYHLKQYTGMLQGVFEPVAERKRGTIDRLFNDFPERSFVLIGDSGEADLEVYVETALMYPGRILGIFIRDVTTDPKRAFFHSSAPDGALQNSRRPPMLSPQDAEPRPALPPRRVQPKAEEELPDLGDLIDFSEDSEQDSAPEQGQSSGLGLPAALKPTPPPPAKPLALRSKSSYEPNSKTEKSTSQVSSVSRKPVPPQPPKPQRLASGLSERSGENSKPSTPNPYKQTLPPPPPPPRRPNHPAGNSASSSASTKAAPPPPAPRGTGNASDPPVTSNNQGAPALPPRRAPCTYTAAAIQYASSKVWYGQQTGSSAETPYDRRVELWTRRLERAQTVLQPKGIMLRTWRVGSDVQPVVEELIRKAQKSGM